LSQIQHVSGTEGTRIDAGASMGLEAGTEISVDQGFGISADSMFEEVFGLGIDYECKLLCYHRSVNI
jgi:hypothetical protein